MLHQTGEGVRNIPDVGGVRMAPAVKGQGDSWDRQGGCGVGCGSDPCLVWGRGVGRVRNALPSGNAWMQEGNQERAPRETAGPGGRAGRQAQGQGALVESEVGLRRPVRSRHLPDVCCDLPCPAAGSRRGPSRAEGGIGWGSCQCKASWGDSPSRTWGEEQELQQGMCRHTGAPDPKDPCPLGPPKLPPLPGERGASHSRVGQEGGLCLHHCLLPRGLGGRHTHTHTHRNHRHTHGNHTHIRKSRSYIHTHTSLHRPGSGRRTQGSPVVPHPPYSSPRAGAGLGPFSAPPARLVSPQAAPRCPHSPQRTHEGGRPAMVGPQLPLRGADLLLCLQLAKGQGVRGQPATCPCL